ncbi:Hypothetical predicted protein [Mytilus galloprovincialis]|uniref:Uncharacterized protein n=1 Tax=Mytilus galloprovincialis TaxID=29158 RepID=A0A8B6DBQ8_MYTGA|nr:Hypothetical predicted protein [Mytilus galloprovincialis]
MLAIKTTNNIRLNRIIVTEKPTTSASTGLLLPQDNQQHPTGTRLCYHQEKPHKSHLIGLWIMLPQDNPQHSTQQDNVTTTTHNIRLDRNMSPQDNPHLPTQQYNVTTTTHNIQLDRIMSPQDNSPLKRIMLPLDNPLDMIMLPQNNLRHPT